MLLNTSWTKITTTSGYGALVQKHGLSKVLISYADTTPTTEDVHSVINYLPETFTDTSSTGYIWAKAQTGEVELSVTEVDLVTDSGGHEHGGFLDYNDTSTASSSLGLVAGVWSRLPNDGLGAFTNLTYPPTGVTSLMTSAGFIDPTQLALGDVILIRNDFTVVPSTNNQSIRLRYTLGAGAGQYTLEKTLGRMDEGSGIDYRFSLGVDEIYMGDLNTRDNLIGVEVLTSGTGDLVNAGLVITVIKRTT